MVVDEQQRARFLAMSSKNRMFFDHLVCLLWCECRAGVTTKSKDWHEWCDIELNYYGTSMGAIIDEELGRAHTQSHIAKNRAFNTPRRVFNDRDLDSIQAFINTHTFRNITDAQQQIADDLFNSCVACGLSVLNEQHEQPAEFIPQQLSLFLTLNTVANVKLLKIYSTTNNMKAAINIFSRILTYTTPLPTRVEYCNFSVQPPQVPPQPLNGLLWGVNTVTFQYNRTKRGEFPSKLW